MKCRLTVPSEGQHIWHDALLPQFLKLLLQAIDHLVGSRQRVLRAPLLVEAALAIDAVEAAHLPALGQEVDAQRDAQPAAVYRPEHRRIIDYGTHFSSFRCIFRVQRYENKMKNEE